MYSGFESFVENMYREHFLSEQALFGLVLEGEGVEGAGWAVSLPLGKEEKERSWRLFGRRFS